jgi:hypothetical protein
MQIALSVAGHIQLLMLLYENPQSLNAFSDFGSDAFQTNLGTLIFTGKQAGKNESTVEMENNNGEEANRASLF